MLFNVEVEDKKLEKILERFEKAQEEIRDCYDELRSWEFFKIVPVDDSTRDDQAITGPQESDTD